MRVRISKAFDFDAAHRLPMLPVEHKCHRLHGHTYKAEIICEGEVEPTLGWLVDYAAIAGAWFGLIHSQLDHRCLNDVPGLENPTTEVLAHWILERLRTTVLPIKRVRVYESSTTWCEAEAA